MRAGEEASRRDSKALGRASASLEYTLPNETGEDRRVRLIPGDAVREEEGEYLLGYG